MDLFQIDEHGTLFIAPAIDDWQPIADHQIQVIFDLDSELDRGVPTLGAGEVPLLDRPPVVRHADQAQRHLAPRPLRLGLDVPDGAGDGPVAAAAAQHGSSGLGAVALIYDDENRLICIDYFY